MQVQHVVAHPDVERANELGRSISRLAAHIHAAHYRFLVMIREFDALDGWGHQGCRSCAHWLNWRCGISLHTAREKVRVAKALAELPQVSDAFEQGRISYSKARAITRIAHAGNEAFLLSIALHGTASHLDRLVRLETRRVSRQEVEARFHDAHDARTFHWFEREDGCIEFRGTLAKESAARLIKALQVIEKTAMSERAVPAGTPGGQACNAATDSGHVPAGTRDGRFAAPVSRPGAIDGRPTVDQRRADALVRLADEWLAGKRQATRSNDSTTVFLHVPAGTSTQPVYLEPGGAIPMAAARRLCCDAGIVPIVEDAGGNPLDIGRKTRKIPPALRRALHARDHGCCRFPGCTNTHFLDGHHVTHWADGGETRLDNLVLLCSHHHGLVHEGGFGCRMASGVPRFTTRDGRDLPTAWRLTGLDERRETRRDFESDNARFDVHADTCLPDWHGDAMDYDMALQGLHDLRVS